MKAYRTAGNNKVQDDRMDRVKNRIKNLLLEDEIWGIADHKGTLRVYWISSPKIQEAITINELWEDENENFIIHYVLDERLVIEVSL